LKFSIIGRQTVAVKAKRSYYKLSYFSEIYIRTAFSKFSKNTTFWNFFNFFRLYIRDRFQTSKTEICKPSCPFKYWKFQYFGKYLKNVKI